MGHMADAIAEREKQLRSVPHSIELTCTWMDNGCSGIEIDQSSLPLHEGDKLVLNEGSTLKIPIGRAVFSFPPDGKQYEFTGPATLRVGGSGLAGERSAYRFRMVVGRLWALVADKPFIEVTVNNAVAGVRG
jgi:hypothetical protein